jgi:DNA invertase Pin-like site-specific DNA recombinase
MTTRKTRTAPAVGDIRMSTDKQEESPAQQRAEVLKLADQHGFHIVRCYQDDAQSGAKTHKRKAFVQMIGDATERGDFDAILCWDQDRFGRFDSIEAGEWISPLRRAGVELICVVQGRINWEDFAGRMIYQITQEGKHRYLVDLSRNALRGMIHYAKAGNVMGMPTPYGFDRVYFDEAGKEVCRIERGKRFRKPKAWSAKLVPEQSRGEVETLRWIFDTFTTGDGSARSLAVDLNARNKPSPSGGQWEFTHIKNRLRHPVYIGTLAYGRRSVGMYHGVGADGELKATKGPRDDCDDFAPIMVPDNHEAIIDEKTFEIAQAKLKARSRV